MTVLRKSHTSKCDVRKGLTAPIHRNLPRILHMSLEGPPTPIDEYTTSTMAIPAWATPEQIEQMLENVDGRVNIVNNTIYREAPECAGKAGLTFLWGQFYGKFMDTQRYRCTGATGGTAYADGSFLNPNISVWDCNDVNRLFKGGVHEHLMRQGPAPNWVLEYVWQSEVLKEGKGVDKVESGYFNKFGTNNTRVDEAWILVKQQDVPIAQQPPQVCCVLRVLRHLSDVAIVGFLVFWPLLWLLDTITGTNRFTGKAIRRNGPPPDRETPYLMVYFRTRQHIPYGYYWLEWHEKFYAPPASVYYAAPGLPVDKLLSLMSDV
jgi:hypothetical protein